MPNIPIKLRVIPKPADGTRAVFVRPDGDKVGGPYWRGNGSIDFVCGKCGNVLLEAQQDNGTLSNIVYQCSCGAFNEAATN